MQHASSLRSPWKRGIVKSSVRLAGLYLVGLSLAALSPTALVHADADTLRTVIDSPHRSEASSARDEYRHPFETLEFFRVRPNMTVVEIWPGAGWYTEILAPYLKESGTYYAAHFPADTEVDYFRRSLAGFEAKLAAAPELYGEVNLVALDPDKGVLNVPDGSADRVLTFRNVHNWLRNDGEQTAFDLFFRVLKPGGILGVVEHRGNPGIDRAAMLNTGYMDEETMIGLATNAGFVLDGRSDINANLRDTKDHPKGVWTLPPNLRLGDENRERYQAIGESDRMTLRFRKPENGVAPVRD